LVYAPSAAEEKAVESKADWALRRDAILHNMQIVMGSLPDPSRRVPLDVEILSEEETPSYLRRRISFAAEPGDRVPAWLLIPRADSSLVGQVGAVEHVRRDRAPAMLCLHQTTGLGKGEPAGLGGSENLHYAHELAVRGYVCIVPDYPSFGDYEFDFAHPRFPYTSGSMKAVWNNIRALDVLESLPQVDADRIGCIGHSLGGHNGLFTAVFDLRIRAVVTSCGFTAFADYYGGDLRGWTSPRYMPRIAERYGSRPDRVPFDFHEVVAAIAPRPLFVNAPVRDDNFDVGGVKKIATAARQVYELLGHPSHLIVAHPECAHDFPVEVREAAYTWLAEALGNGR
jgi:dienelactone hydrolase